ncbi:site-2 protease family protein [Patescibacteria group bacterium]|nr:site-2 protease family protein [Patescibacteria group bacterium]MBU1970710.1 site-2 protease family protein [Patescibacteria group bacterium]
MMALIIFILILSLLVLVHEFGHFFVARKMGVRVEEFGFGIPPRLWGKKIGETVYSINALPFGGFVKVAGEDEVELLDKNDPGNFANKSWGKRLAILLAGVVMNILLAITIFYVFFGLNNFRTASLPLLYDYEFAFGRVLRNNTVIFGFEEDSVAQKAGVGLGEAIWEINGQRVFNVHDVRYQIKDQAGQVIRVKLLDTKEIKPSTREVTIVPTTGPNGAGFLGVALATSVTIDYGDTLSSKLTSGLQHALNVLGYSLATFSQLVSTSVAQKSIEPVSAGVSGPVGIFSIVGVILAYQGVNIILGLLDFVAILSLSLAFINILPLPALDGGRAIFVLFEGLTRKKVSPKFEAGVHRWGMIGLLALTFLVTAKDIVNLF